MLLAVLILPTVVYADSFTSARGSGHFTFLGEWRTFSFTAHKDTDGNVTGQAQTKNRYSGSKRHIVINCMEDFGVNSVIVGGIITKSNDENEIGQRVVFAVEDNGSGSNNLPDRLTGLFFLPPIPDIPDCAAPPFEPPYVPIEAGNITLD
ncbi:MAG: hypothetical protein HC806_10590 [Anaerolineae bacterium]|nr:hypothetical protein [Anaerolineae bacterium]